MSKLKIITCESNIIYGNKINCIINIKLRVLFFEGG